MNSIRILICIFIFGLQLCFYIDKQNQLTDLRIRLPEIAQEIKMIREENTRVQYEIDTFENPGHLMELVCRSEFSHLKHPLLKEIITCQEGTALKEAVQKFEATTTFKPKPTLATR